jgi:biopolymer transport protein ExbD
VDLPQVKAAPNEVKPDVIRLALDASGQVFWNDTGISDEELAARLGTAGQRASVPEVHLSADRNTRYQRIADVMSAARQAGVQKLGFITLPPK